MTLAELVAADVDDVFLNSDEFGETVSYTPSGGSVRSIVVVIGRRQNGLKDDRGHLVDTGVITVYAKKSATTGINAPAKGDKIVRGGVTFNYVAVIEEDVGSYRLEYHSPQIVSTGHRQGFGY